MSRLVAGTELTQLQMDAANALISGASFRAAALEAECTINSLHRWSKDPEFARIVSEGKRQAFQNASTRLAAGSFKAVCVLESIADDLQAPHSARVKAASDLLSHAIKVAELVDLQDRITQIEITLKAS